MVALKKKNNLGSILLCNNYTWVLQVISSLKEQLLLRFICSALFKRLQPVSQSGQTKGVKTGYAESGEENSVKNKRSVKNKLGVCFESQCRNSIISLFMSKFCFVNSVIAKGISDLAGMKYKI